ncbi:MAG TPA: hydroxymethylglutaryl-CoA lyase [Rhabdaerophilum sp.]|nr:hydroxymethylglutaryl-CoA lyase [Rhabdaerophilum sp.]
MSRSSVLYPAERLVLREVGLRDGLQLVKVWPSTADKIAWLRAEYAAGVRHFELGSFLPASRMPQFADLRELIAASGTLPGARSAALALNERGGSDALATEVDEIVCVVSATEEHSQANMRRSRADALSLVREIVAKRDAAGHKAIVNVGISMAFGCSIAGDVSEREVLRLVEACLGNGADAVGLADTVGYAGPRQVGDLAAMARKLAGEVPVIIHLHDTRGVGLANAAAALDAGIRVLDASLCGLGGCPFAPGATGNIVFEDLVFLAESMGFDTGIALDRLEGPRAVLARAMPDEPLHGQLSRAGVPKSRWRTCAA